MGDNDILHFYNDIHSYFLELKVRYSGAIIILLFLPQALYFQLHGLNLLRRSNSQQRQTKVKILCR